MSDRYMNDQACGIEPEIEGDEPTLAQWRDRCRQLWSENVRMREAGTTGTPQDGTKDWRDVAVTTEFLADLFDAYCGADGHNLVVSIAAGRIGQPIR